MAETLTIREIVASDEFKLVLDVVRIEADRYRKEMLALDPSDPSLGGKAVALAAKSQALRSLCRRFYEEAGMESVLGDQAVEALV